MHSVVDQRFDEIDATLRELLAQLQGFQDEARSGLRRIAGQLDDSYATVHQSLATAHQSLGAAHQSLAALQAESAASRGDVTWLRDRIAESRDDARRLLSGQLETKRIAGGLLDRIPELRERLVSVRTLPSYASVFEENEPLVTVCMPTYNRADLLLERSIPSVLSQSYQHFEVVIVGDGCTDDTAERIALLDDPRIRFVNLPHRSVSPSDPAQRWMVAGVPPRNLAAELARGRWIAPLDDDDEFSPEHIAVLLGAAREGRFEMVCSRFASTAPYHEPILGRYPPELGQFCFQATIYMTDLRFFEADPRAWMLDEVEDWNRCRRMLEAGVRIGWVDQVLTTMHPTGPRYGGEGA
jgi:hypothetical protein